MSITVTQKAAEVLRRSLELGGVDPVSGGVRLRLARGLGGGAGVQVELANSRSGDEIEVETEGVRLFVSPEIEATFPSPIVDVSQEHERIVVRSRAGP